MPVAPPSQILLGFLFLNLWTMLCFHLDKSRAIAGAKRIRESELLFLAFIGGTPGAFLARHLFRHKTQKQPFGNRLATIGFIQIGMIMGWLLI